jgi:hypothetical protein
MALDRSIDSVDGQRYNRNVGVYTITAGELKAEATFGEYFPKMCDLNGKSISFSGVKAEENSGLYGMEFLAEDGYTYKIYLGLKGHQAFSVPGFVVYAFTREETLTVGDYTVAVTRVIFSEENIESGAYNPLLYRFDYKGNLSGSGELADETPQQFRDRIHENLVFNLYHYLAVLSEQTGSLDIKKNQGIIDNVIYFGMNRKTEEIINKNNNTEENNTINNEGELDESI